MRDRQALAYVLVLALILLGSPDWLSGQGPNCYECDWEYSHWVCQSVNDGGVEVCMTSGISCFEAQLCELRMPDDLYADGTSSRIFDPSSVRSEERAGTVVTFFEYCSQAIVARKPGAAARERYREATAVLVL